MNTTKHDELDPLAPRLEEALLLLDMSQTRLGYMVAGDPALVKKMRAGRKFRPQTRARIEDFLREHGL